MGLFACGQPNGDAHAVYADPFSPCQLVPASAAEREILAARYLDDLDRVGSGAGLCTRSSGFTAEGEDRRRQSTKPRRVTWLIAAESTAHPGRLATSL